jgi:hypothetical protein
MPLISRDYYVAIGKFVTYGRKATDDQFGLHVPPFDGQRKMLTSHRFCVRHECTRISSKKIEPTVGLPAGFYVLVGGMGMKVTLVVAAVLLIAGAPLFGWAQGLPRFFP